MDNTVLAVATIVLGLVGAAVFFLSQPAQAKSRSTGGSMKPRGEGGSNPCNQMAQHALSTLPMFWQTTGTNNEAAASQSNRSTRSKCLDAVVRYGSDPHWVTHVALGIKLWCGTYAGLGRKRECLLLEKEAYALGNERERERESDRPRLDVHPRGETAAKLYCCVPERERGLLPLGKWS